MSLINHQTSNHYPTKLKNLERRLKDPASFCFNVEVTANTAYKLERWILAPAPANTKVVCNCFYVPSANQARQWAIPYKWSFLWENHLDMFDYQRAKGSQTCSQIRTGLPSEPVNSQSTFFQSKAVRKPAQRDCEGQPANLTWNHKMAMINRNILFQIPFLGFHVGFRWCMLSIVSPSHTGKV